MELTIIEKNNLTEEIKKYETLIATNINAIQNLKNANINQFFISAKLDKLKQQNENYQKKLELLLNTLSSKKQIDKHDKKVKFIVGTDTEDIEEKYSPVKGNKENIGINTICRKFKQTPDAAGHTWRGINFFNFDKCVPNKNIILYERQNGVIQQSKITHINEDNLV